MQSILIIHTRAFKLCMRASSNTSIYLVELRNGISIGQENRSSLFGSHRPDCDVHASRDDKVEVDHN